MDCPICGYGRYSCRCRESELRDYDREHHYEMDYESDQFVHNRLHDYEDKRRAEEEYQLERAEEERQDRRRREQLEEQRQQDEYEKAWPDPPTPEPEPDEDGK